VVDLDLEHDDAQQWLADNRDRVPLTRTHRTRSGGMHWLFAPNDKVKCSAGKLGPHIDTRGNGGYVIWWPACGLEVLHGTVFAQVPDWILELLNPTPVLIVGNVVPFRGGPTSGSIRGALGVLARAREGERNSALYWTSCRLAEAVQARTLNEGEAFDLLLSVGRQIGLQDREIFRTARSAFEKGIA